MIKFDNQDYLDAFIEAIDQQLSESTLEKSEVSQNNLSQINESEAGEIKTFKQPTDVESFGLKIDPIFLKIFCCLH